ncbi:MAG: helix-turn-helix domain-containing protein [Candidatus Sulfotelmatobacter sp.]
MSTDELLSPLEASALLGIKAQTLAIWRCKKRYSLKYIKVGATVKYRRRDIDQFLDERTVTNEPVEARRRVRR